MNLLPFLKKNLTTIIIAAALIVFFLLKGCGNKSGDLTVESTTCDTTFVDVVVFDTTWIEAPIPEPTIEFVTRFVEIEVHDTVFIAGGDIVVPEPEIRWLTRQDSLFVYDSLFVQPDYKLYWHVESLGRVRAFAHRLEFTKTEAHITQTNNIIPRYDHRKWSLLAGVSLLTKTDARHTDDYYFGGSLLRTEKSFSYGAGYQHRIGGKGNLFHANFGINF